MTAVAAILLAGALLCAPDTPARGRLQAVTGPVRKIGRTQVRLPGLAWLLAAGIGLGWLVAGFGGAVAGVVVVGVWGRRRSRRRSDAAAETAGVELADALTRMTDEMRAGAHPAAALAGIGADGPHARAVLAPAASAARLGEAVPAALARSCGEQALAADVDRIAAAWALADRHGVPLADLLGGVRDDLRWRIAFGRRVRAELAGPRATAAVLTALPALGLGLGQLLGADPLVVLRTGLLGPALLVVGIGLAGAGVLWSEQILRSAAPR
ncbi:type II secretion system F family protein [Pseudonocardia hispaniensis]|uniref:Type II secretion system F family protein n=1 Tax=Pseudonocardia hispaniensis TaxID=904933 RepID=A0ABW1J244_9PSEU